MVGIVLMPEQIKAAPLEVRAWLRSLVDAELAVPRQAAERPHTIEDKLATCSLPEAAAILQRIGGDHLVCQVFFELGRDAPAGPAGPPHLHRLAIGELARHARIADGRRLIAAIEAINAAFQSVRGDAAASLFAFDQQGGCYIQAATHESIKQLWRDLVGAEPGAAAAD